MLQSMGSQKSDTTEQLNWLTERKKDKEQIHIKFPDIFNQSQKMLIVLIKKAFGSESLKYLLKFST